MAAQVWPSSRADRAASRARSLAVRSTSSTRRNRASSTSGCSPADVDLAAISSMAARTRGSDQNLSARPNSSVSVVLLGVAAEASRTVRPTGETVMSQASNTVFVTDE